MIKVPENKTQPTSRNIEDYLAGVEEKRREECRTLIALMTDITGEEPCIWGDSIVGFGTYHYKYATGREGDFLISGFSPRKRNLSIYIMAGFDHFQDLMQKLGKYKTGVSCLYVTKLDDIDLAVLRELVAKSVAWVKKYAHVEQ